MPSISERAVAGIKAMPESEKQQYASRTRLVTEDEIGDVLRWLATNAAEIGEAKRRVVETENMLKRGEAVLFLASSEKTVEAKKFSVRASDRWLEYANEAAHAAGEFERMKALREAAMAKLDAWRTESASNRASVR